MSGFSWEKKKAGLATLGRLFYMAAVVGGSWAWGPQTAPYSPCSQYLCSVLLYLIAFELLESYFRFCGTSLQHKSSLWQLKPVGGRALAMLGGAVRVCVCVRVHVCVCACTHVVRRLATSQARGG